MKSMQSLHKVPNKTSFITSVICRSGNRFFSSVKEEEESLEVQDKPPSFAEEEIDEPKPENFFNKSGLNSNHRNFLHNVRPYSEPHSWIHLTEKYQRKQLGRYGLAASGVDPRICFPTQKDIDANKEYERVAFPFTLQELMAKSKEEEKSLKEQVEKREEDIMKKLQKLEQWKADLNAKIAKKEADALAARQRKERLVEEVRRHFGFKVDPREDRFKEMLEQKEKEDRKKQKEAKRKAKEEKMMAKLIANPTDKKGITKEETVA